MTKLCSPKYRAIGVSIDSQVLNQTLFNILVNSGCVDLTELCIAKGKLVWVLYCDLVCLDDDGAALDVAALSLVAALKSLNLPKVNFDLDTKAIQVDDKIKTALKLKCLPVTSTFVMMEENHLIADPTADEENIAGTTVTISISDGQISYVYQPGGSSIQPQQFESLVKHATNREKYLKSLLGNIFA